jgi:hypothetical protein
MAKKRLGISHAASIQSHGGDKRDLDPIKKFNIVTKMVGHVLTRAPMISRLYHPSYRKEG